MWIFVVIQCGFSKFCNYIVTSATRSNIAPATRSSEPLFSQHALTSTALSLSFSTCSHFRQPHKWFKEPQNLLKRTENFIFKSYPLRTLNIKQNISKEHRSFFISSTFFPRSYWFFPLSAALKTERLRRDKDAAGQQYYTEENSESKRLCLQTFSLFNLINFWPHMTFDARSSFYYSL